MLCPIWMLRMCQLRLHLQNTVRDEQEMQIERRKRTTRSVMQLNWFAADELLHADQYSV